MRPSLRYYWPLALGAALSACVSTPAIKVRQTWEQRVAQLTTAQAWQMQGRVAAAIGQQGWQASLDWRQMGAEAAVRLAGPLGVGAVSLRLTPAGIVLARPSASGTVDADELIRERMGFTPPFDDLRYWLLGVAAPAKPAQIERNPQDRAAHIMQGGWSIEYTRYLAVGADLLPAQVTLRHDDVRVRIVVDRWNLGLPL